jgi:hypothetical protein
VDGIGPGRTHGRTVTGHARLPRAVRLLIRPAAPDWAGPGSGGRTSQTHDTTRVSHSTGHAHRHRSRPGSSPNRGQSHSHSTRHHSTGLERAGWTTHPTRPARTALDAISMNWTPIGSPPRRPLVTVGCGWARRRGCSTSTGASCARDNTRPAKVVVDGLPGGAGRCAAAATHSPARSQYSIALSSSRRWWTAGRPPGLGAGISGARMCHWASDVPLGVGQVTAVAAAGRGHRSLLEGQADGEAPQPTAFSDTLYDYVNASLYAVRSTQQRSEDRQFSGVAVRRTSGPMRTTSSSWKRLASAMLGAPGPASAGLPPPPINTGAI